MVLPLVMLLGLGLLQVGVVVRDQLALGLAAREGARAAAVSADVGSAARAAVDRVLPHGSATVSTSTDHTMVTVEVRSAVSVALPVVGALIRARELSATATMAIDPLDPP